MEEVLLSSSSSSASLNSFSSSSSSYLADEAKQAQLPLLSLNHVSFVCKSVSRSVRFYEEVLGFVLIKRPSSFDFEGAWAIELIIREDMGSTFTNQNKELKMMAGGVLTLDVVHNSNFIRERLKLFNHGIGIHLLQVADVPSKKGRINPKDNHISFQTSNMDVIVQKLEDMNIEYVTAVVKEGGITVDQLFFHDPDGYMIEICNCQNLPVLPLSSCPLKKIPRSTASDQIKSSLYGKATSNLKYCCGEVEALMMENLAVDMLNISF